MLTVTQAAATKIRQSAIDSNADDMALRVAAKINDAGMIEFGIGFDHERENDQIIDSWGITILISQHSRDLLTDVTLDFTTDEHGLTNFVFMKATSEAPDEASCGNGTCGSGGCSTGSCGS